jgi:hypothetical protein
MCKEYGDKLEVGYVGGFHFIVKHTLLQYVTNECDQPLQLKQSHYS